MPTTRTHSWPSCCTRSFWRAEATTYGDVDQNGFRASLLIVEAAEQPELTDAFDRPILVGICSTYHFIGG